VKKTILQGTIGFREIPYKGVRFRSAGDDSPTIAVSRKQWKNNLEMWGKNKFNLKAL
jgi:ABC-type tungstate transport system permease subunit